MIIGLAGPAFVGKTTTANFLRDNLGYEVLPYSTPLKEALITLTGMDRKVFFDSKEKLVPRDLFNGKSSREIMQKFGTEFCRNMITQDFWLRLMKERLAVAGEKVVIDDIRFQDEADLVTSLGGTVVNLLRKGVEFDGTHASEVGVKAGLVVYLPEGVEEAEGFVIRELRGYGVI